MSRARILIDGSPTRVINSRAWSQRPLVYVAGPYSSDPIGNTRKAIEVAEVLHSMGMACVVPHLSMVWDFHRPHDVEWWYEYDLALLARCDALYRIKGESTGADREVEYAESRGIPVFTRTEKINRHFVMEGR